MTSANDPPVNGRARRRREQTRSHPRPQGAAGVPARWRCGTGRCRLRTSRPGIGGRPRCPVRSRYRGPPGWLRQACRRLPSRGHRASRPPRRRATQVTVTSGATSGRRRSGTGPPRYPPSLVASGFGRTVIRLLLHRDETGRALADNADPAESRASVSWLRCTSGRLMRSEMRKNRPLISWRRWAYRLVGMSLTQVQHPVTARRAA
jgi:hypothetical protein